MPHADSARTCKLCIAHLCHDQLWSEETSGVIVVGYLPEPRWSFICSNKNYFISVSGRVDTWATTYHIACNRLSQNLSSPLLGTQ